MGTEFEVSRAAVERWWREVAEGNCSRRTASYWAEQHLNKAPTRIEELALQGLLYLQALRHRRSAVDATGTPDADVAAALDACRAALARYDADPNLWTRSHYLSMLKRFATSRGRDAAIRFATKLQREGVIADTDVEQLHADE